MQLTFLGAAQMVTGSSFLLELAGQKVLVDCGMFQGSKAIRALNQRPFAFNPAELKCVLLTHAHIDHSGLLPRLCKAGFKGPIYATKITSELCSIMLPDSGHIQEFDAEIANRKGQRAGRKPVEPLYTVTDAYACLEQFKPVAYDEKITVLPELTVRFRDAGHIFGSAMIELWVTEANQTQKLVFSGDIGQPNQPLLKDPTYIMEADYVIMESTYGNRHHDAEDNPDLLAKIINESVSRGGNVIIPAFAVGRTQTILYYLQELLQDGKIPDIPVFIDSPLAISATHIFMENAQEYDQDAYDMFYKQHINPLQLPQLKTTKTAEESKAINSLDRPAIIISASGMADAGRILHHLKHNLWRPEASVLLVGYQAQGSLGRRLLEGAKRVKIMGEEISVKASIHNLDGFSAHADQAQLFDWLSHFTTDPTVFVVHGEQDMSMPFAALIKEKLNIVSVVPNYGDRASIQGRTWSVEQSGFTLESGAVKQLREYLEQLEKDYQAYWQRLEQTVAADAAKLPTALRQLGKISELIKKMLKNS